MKRISKLLLTLYGLLTSVMAASADPLTDANINATELNNGVFYTQIWFWLIVGVAFMVLIAALLRGDSKN